VNCTVYWINDRPVGRIGIMPRPRGGDWLDDEMRSLTAQGVNVVVSLLTQEEMEELDLTHEPEICAQNGIEFLSFPIKDRDAPPLDAKFKEFVASLQGRLAKGKSLMLHCRAGIGRSSIIAACLVISPGAPVNEVLRLISHARGFPVPDTEEQFEWVCKFAEWNTEDDQ